jgi:hypothetical protein
MRSAPLSVKPQKQSCANNKCSQGDIMSSHFLFSQLLVVTCSIHVGNDKALVILKIESTGSSAIDGSPVLPEPKQLDSKDKMTYTEQAAKRKHCQRLTRLLSFFKPEY